MIGDHAQGSNPEHFSPVLAGTIDQHMPNQRCQASGTPGLEPGTCSVLFAEVVVTQSGVEPVTTRCLVVVLTTKPLGRRWALCGRGREGARNCSKNRARAAWLVIERHINELRTKFG